MRWKKPLLADNWNLCLAVLKVCGGSLCTARGLSQTPGFFWQHQKKTNRNKHSIPTICVVSLSMFLKGTKVYIMSSFNKHKKLPLCSF